MKNNRSALESQMRSNAQWMSSIGLLLSGLLLVSLSTANVHHRRQECGVWLALGYSRTHLAILFLGRAALAGVLAAALAIAVHLLILRFDYGSSWSSMMDKQLLLSVLFAAPGLALLAAAVPCLKAATQRPAEILRSES